MDTAFQKEGEYNRYCNLLGRAPNNLDEMRYHSSVLDQQGFEIDIDTYLDSDEYQTAFGETFVPYYRGLQTQPGQSLLQFTNMTQLLRSASSSDQDPSTQNRPLLTRALIQNVPYGKQKFRDASDILAEVFKTKTPVQSTVPSVYAVPSYAAVESDLQRKNQEQTQAIARLQVQLADLCSVGAIGAAYLKSDWSPSAPAAAESGAAASLQQQVEAQTAQIAALQDQISDARRYAAIGEARLNKWRSRVFNG